MKSTAHFKSHPLHPILIVFPIAFFMGCFIFDLLGWLSDNDALITTGRYLNIAGIAGAILAAIPGIIDFIYTVPPKSSAKTRAAKHGLLNTAVLLIFAAVLAIRGSIAFEWIIAMEVLGVVLLNIAGWMGGTLVHRNQIGVDMRYAGAGKWKEERHDEKSGKIRVASGDELALNQMKLIHIGKRRIVVGKSESGYVAFDDFCTHRGGSLAGGSMICGTVQCPWHGSQFDVKTGTIKAGPAEKKINTYPLTEENGDYYLSL